MTITHGYGRRLASLMKRSMSCLGLLAPRRTPWLALVDGNFVRLLDFPRPPLRAVAPPQSVRGEACLSLDPPQVCRLAPLLMSPLVAAANEAGPLRPLRRMPRTTELHLQESPCTTLLTCFMFALVVGTLVGGSSLNDAVAPAPLPFVLTGAVAKAALCQLVRLPSAACAPPGLQYSLAGPTDSSMNAA